MMDTGCNVYKAMRGMGKTKTGGIAEWSRCCCHLLHNVVGGALKHLEARAHTNPHCKTLHNAISW